MHMSQPALVIFVIEKCMLVLTITFLEQFGTYNCLNHDHPSTLPTLCRRWFNVCLLTGLMDTLDFNKRDINIFISETWQKYAGDCSKLQDGFNGKK
jgi:hypothetical protein